MLQGMSGFLVAHCLVTGVCIPIADLRILWRQLGGALEYRARSLKVAPVDVRESDVIKKVRVRSSLLGCAAVGGEGRVVPLVVTARRTEIHPVGPLVRLLQRQRAIDFLGLGETAARMQQQPEQCLRVAMPRNGL